MATNIDWQDSDFYDNEELGDYGNWEFHIQPSPYQYQPVSMNWSNYPDFDTDGERIFKTVEEAKAFAVTLIETTK